MLYWLIYVFNYFFLRRIIGIFLKSSDALTILIAELIRTTRDSIVAGGMGESWCVSQTDRPQFTFTNSTAFLSVLCSILISGRLTGTPGDRIDRDSIEIESSAAFHRKLGKKVKRNLLDEKTSVSYRTPSKRIERKS